ncbi:hypothetical protein D9M68_681870 [compost metagenome]
METPAQQAALVDALQQASGDQPGLPIDGDAAEEAVAESAEPAALVDGEEGVQPELAMVDAPPESAELAEVVSTDAAEFAEEVVAIAEAVVPVDEALPVSEPETGEPPAEPEVAAAPEEPESDVPSPAADETDPHDPHAVSPGKTP